MENDNLENDLKKIEELQNELNKIKNEEDEDLLIKEFDENIQLLENDNQKEIEYLKNEIENLKQKDIKYQGNEINNNFMETIEQYIIKGIDNQLNKYFKNNNNIENQINQVKKSINDEYNNLLEKQFKDIFLQVKNNIEQVKKDFSDKLEIINESLKKINEELNTQENINQKNIKNIDINEDYLEKSDEKINKNENNEMPKNANNNIYNKKIINEEIKNHNYKKKNSNNNISIFKDLIDKEDKSNQKIENNLINDQKQNNKCSLGQPYDNINNEFNPKRNINKGINNFLNDSKINYYQSFNYNNLNNKEKFTYNKNTKDGPKKISFNQSREIPKVLSEAKKKNYLTILKKTFFLDQGQRYINNKRMNKYEREELIREIIDNRKQGQDDVESNIKLFIEKIILPLIRKNTLTDEEVKTVKYNISLILDCLGLDRNYYDDLYQDKAKTTIIDRNKSKDAAKKFRKEYGIGKDIITDDALEERIIKNDYKLENVMQDMYG